MAFGPHRRHPGASVKQTLRSLGFAAVYSIYLLVVLGPAQWLAIRPICALWPARRLRVVRAWLRLQAKVTMGLARRLGGLRLQVEGALPASSCVVLMNHQSLMDVPLGISLIEGPLPVIPTRTLYRRGIPGIAGLMSLVGGPFVAQGAQATRAERDALVAGADAVARGERTFLLFPEGHRSRSGEILPFMTAGLERVLARAWNRPLYLVVEDGLARLTGFSQIATRLAGTSVRVVVRGPYAIPQDPRDHPAFIERLRAEMIAAHARLRAPAAPGVIPLAARAELAG